MCRQQKEEDNNKVWPEGHRDHKKNPKMVQWGEKNIILEIKMEIQHKGFLRRMLRWKVTKDWGQTVLLDSGQMTSHVSSPARDAEWDMPLLVSPSSSLSNEISIWLTSLYLLGMGTERGLLLSYSHACTHTLWTTLSSTSLGAIANPHWHKMGKDAKI